MEFLTELWVPIVVSALVVWFASFAMWMLFPHHKSEWNGISDEKGFRGALIELGLGSGQYVFPYAPDPGKLKDPEYKEYYEKGGPHGHLVIWGGLPNMGANMIKTLVLLLLLGAFLAYIGHYALHKGERYLKVFQVIGTAAILAHTFSNLFHSIWFAKPARAMFTEFFDGVVYGLLTAGVFGWLWPEA